MRSSNLEPLRTAVAAALVAGRILMASYGRLTRSQISTKSKNDFVTIVDKRSEQAIIRLIKKSFPQDRIQAEESGVSTGKGRLWIIDPLDGTSNYIHQMPLFSVSIGIQKDGILTAGVIYDPLHKELFTALKGQGAHLNGKRIHVSRVNRLADAFMTTGIPFRARGRFDEYFTSFRHISSSSMGLRRGGSAALDLAYVASGRFDGFWEIDLSPWDVAAGAVLVREAGGIMTDVWGGRNYLKTGDILASNGLIHEELKKITLNSFSSNPVDKTCR